MAGLVDGRGGYAASRFSDASSEVSSDQSLCPSGNFSIRLCIAGSTEVGPATEAAAVRRNPLDAWAVGVQGQDEMELAVTDILL